MRPELEVSRSSGFCQAHAAAITVVATLLSLLFSSCHACFVPSPTSISHPFLPHFRLLSALSPIHIIQADQLVLLVGEEFARYTTAHMKALRSDSTTLRKTTLELCRGIKRDAGVTRHCETDKDPRRDRDICCVHCLSLHP